ncbi:MAG TPA: hypothetical protein VMM60_15800 [Ilumatobacter sp.]|nr:hypothetical protein [Ilumatobacter sp.]
MNLERPDNVDVEVLTQRTTVVTALPLKRAARARLAALLDARVVDVRHPIDHVDLVLTPACSPQLIGALKRKYDGARVVVVELDDWEFDVSLPGPVKRILLGGADAYVLADSLEELARKITPRSDRESDDSAPVAARELPSTSTVDELIAAFLRESVEYSTRLRASDQPS